MGKPQEHHVDTRPAAIAAPSVLKAGRPLAIASAFTNSVTPSVALSSVGAMGDIIGLLTWISKTMGG
jgi:hypothetical protein